MADPSSSEINHPGNPDTESLESTVGVNVKTLDSQIYPFRVNKNVSVSLLKEKISSTIGLPVAQQRLIFRGKVLKDEHLLSEYHLEDGDTVHLVVRQPIQPQTSGGASAGQSTGHENRGNDAPPGAPYNRPGQVSHSVLLGTLNVGDQADGIVPDLSRIIGAVLNSIGVGNLVTTVGTSNASSVNSSSTPQPNQGLETGGGPVNSGGRGEAGRQGQPAQAFLNVPFQPLLQPLQFPLQGAMAVPSLQMVVPDALTTLSEFINRMELALSSNAGNLATSPLANVMEANQEHPYNARGLPTPELLTTVMRRAQRLLSGRAGTALLDVAGRIERERSTSDSLIRAEIQAEAMQLGISLQHLGSLLLELGRSIQTLRMGQSPAEAVVNTGPAVYVSSSGPNPLMVQPSPFQTNIPLGFSSTVRPQPNPGISGPVGLGEMPRHINIHIQAGTSVAPVISSVGARESAGETANTTQHPNQGQGTTNGSASADSGPRRVMPVRTVVAAVPARSPAEAASHLFSVLYPLNSRSQPTTLGTPASVQGSSLAASDVEQPAVGNSLQNTESTSLPNMMAPADSQTGNVLENMKQESSSGSTVENSGFQYTSEVQVPSGSLETSTFEGISHGSNICSHELRQHLESNGVVGSISSQLSGPDGIFTMNMHQPQNAERQFTSETKVELMPVAAEASSTCITGESTNSSTSELSSSKSGAQPVVSSTSVSSEQALDARVISEPSNGGKSIPLGLGSGGLQLKESRTKQSKSHGNAVGTKLPVNQNQHHDSISRGQQVLQSLFSQGESMNMAVANGQSMQMPSSDPTDNHSTLGRQNGTGQIDVTNMMSQVLQSPAMNNLLAGFSEQVGIGSPAGFRSAIEQLVQSPSVGAAFDHIAQVVGNQSEELQNISSGHAREGGRIDFSRMFQMLMPVVSQALNQGSTRENSRSVESETQSSGLVSGKRDQEDGSISQAGVQQVDERLRGHDLPSNVFRIVAEDAIHSYGEQSADLLEEICNNDALANEFMEMLRHDTGLQQSGSRTSLDNS